MHRIACVLLMGALAIPLGARAGRPVIVQTNAAGDNIHLIIRPQIRSSASSAASKCHMARKPRPTAAASM